MVYLFLAPLNGDLKKKGGAVLKCSLHTDSNFTIIAPD